MAKSVTLKNSNNEEVYPVTDMGLVNGSAGTSQITDGAVTAAKINWSSLGAKYASDGNQATVGTSATTLLSVSLTAGTWLLLGKADFNHNNTAVGDCFVGFENITAGSTIGMRFYWNDVGNGTYWSDHSAMSVVTLTATSTVAFVAKKGQGTLYSNRKQMVAIRIA